ncbi:hypothetical protein BSL78_22383 [Apostichopus japonicus]|uniref:Fibrous sheath-interacting protein 1 n=1 Tax=Stichopus japonicus TaxID=307972 RepID=A0A2G8JYJ6_STIJA|nr:hypothetical protein BSL78_22383 [Apostichopus japonicus]
MDITRGSLDGITRSGKSHQRQRPGSRVSLQSGSGSPALRLESEIRGSLEILPPETNFDYQERDLSLEEYLSSSDEEESNLSKDEAEGDAIHHLERLILSSSRSSQYAVSVSSDVTDRDGLDGQSFSEKNEGHGSASPRQSNQENKNNDDDDDDEELKRTEDPKIRKAIKKMRKLDKILSQKLTREKEVKRKRLMMHKQYEEELERIRLGLDRSEIKDEVENTMRFLALVPPPAHSEGIDNDEDYAASPLFQTQPLDAGSSKKGQRMSNRAPSASEMSSSSRQSKDGDMETEMETDRSKGGRRRKKSRVETRSRTTNDEDDFIQRNIQLASDAGNMVAMTDDEKKRLGELLQDVEMLGEESQGNQDVIGTEMKVFPGVGFQPNRSEEDALKDLDNKLKVLMPFDSFQEICSTPSVRNHSSNTLIEYSQEAFELGEKILQENRETRDHQDRLKQIEDELVQLQTQVEREENEQTGSDTSRTAKLDDKILRKLLEEAKHGLGFEETFTDGSDIPEGISFGEGEEDEEEENYTQNNDDSLNEENQVGRRLLQNSSSNSRVPLVSHDVIQMLLRNPRVTLDEAKKPTNLESGDVDV